VYLFDKDGADLPLGLIKQNRRENVWGEWMLHAFLTSTSDGRSWWSPLCPGHFARAKNQTPVTQPIHPDPYHKLRFYATVISKSLVWQENNVVKHCYTENAQKADSYKEC
jgi:hypothetical protein